jgi:hypothetical protein
MKPQGRLCSRALGFPDLTAPNKRLPTALPFTPSPFIAADMCIDGETARARTEASGGVNTLGFQIARELSTAISKSPPPPPPSPCGSAMGPAVPAPGRGPAVPQELAGAPGGAYRWTRPFGYMLGLGRRPCFVLVGCMHRSASSTSFSDHRRLLLISAPPQFF